MKLLVTGAFRCSDNQLEYIKSLGHEIVFMQNESDSLPCDYLDIEGVICNGLFLYHHIKKFSNLKYIQLTSAGYDRVPLDYVKEKGIKVFNARGVYSVPMAEYALFGVLSLYKHGKFFYKNQEEKRYEKNRSLIELFGKTVCVVGAGNVGTECAKRFKAFGTKVLGVDLFVREDDAFDKIYPLSSLDEVLKISDVVVLTLPLDKNTENLFNENRFNVMKQGCVFVNIARGKIVDETALIRALDNKLFGAVIDVTVNEPLPSDSELWEKENVILTPHNSFVGDGNNQRLFDLIISNLKGELK
ncbi:MAG: hydroxyacid dehydrogenase [Clostridiales bacterium]|nr:hydroxyacid dehydrogenase [Clostridiales bacterium]